MVFYVYQDRQGFWRWYLRASNGKTIADSGEGYSNRQDCLNGIRLVQGASNAPIHQA
jgi:uncharacterized protein